LTFPVYFNTGTTYCVSPDQQTYASNAMEASFGIDSQQGDFKCVSLYDLHRKQVTETDNQPDDGAAPIGNTTNMYLLVAWVAESNNHKFCVYLIEFTDDFAWDEDKLWSLFSEYNDQFHMDDTSNTIIWLMHDNLIMKTELKVSYGSEYKLDIVISEGNWEYNMKEPIKINPKRSVVAL
jgi:hypothetical protein